MYQHSASLPLAIEHQRQLASELRDFLNDPNIAAIPVIGVSAVGKLVDVEYSFREPLDHDQFLAAVERYVVRPEQDTGTGVA